MQVIITIEADEVEAVIADYVNKNQTLGITVEPKQVVIDEDGSVKILIF